MLSGVYQILSAFKIALEAGLTSYAGKYICRIAKIEEKSDEQVKPYGVYVWLNAGETKFSGDDDLITKDGHLAIDVGIQFESEERFEEACQFMDAIYWLIQEKTISGHIWNWNGTIEEVGGDEIFKGYKFTFKTYTMITE